MQYPFRLIAITPIVEGSTADQSRMPYPRVVVKDAEHLSAYLSDSYHDTFEITYCDVDSLKKKYQVVNKADLASDRKTEIVSNEADAIDYTEPKYPFRLIGITPVINGVASASNCVPCPRNTVRDAKHLNAYIEGSEHDVFEIIYCGVNDSKKRRFTISKSGSPTDTRSYNVGESDYAKHKIQPWDIWLEYNLGPWDADIIKRVLRTKKTDGRRLDYEKIIHICKERIRQIDNEKI